MLYNIDGTQMTQPSTCLKFDLAMKRGDVREAMGWSFIKRLEKLVDELLAKLDCPQEFWVIYSAKWSDEEHKIKELWQVTDEEPRILMGQIIYYVNKAGRAGFVALPMDVPVPDEELSDEIVTENIGNLGNIPLSDQVFEKIN